MNPIVSRLSTQDTDEQDETEETGGAFGAVDADDVTITYADNGGCSRGGDETDSTVDGVEDVTIADADDGGCSRGGDESDSTMDGGEDGTRVDAASEAIPGAGGSTFAPSDSIETVRPVTTRNRSGRRVAGRRRVRSGRRRGRGGRRRRKGRAGRTYLNRRPAWSEKASRKRGRRRALGISRTGGLGLEFVRGGANPVDG